MQQLPKLLSDLFAKERVEIARTCTNCFLDFESKIQVLLKSYGKSLSTGQEDSVMQIVKNLQFDVQNLKLELSSSYALQEQILRELKLMNKQHEDQSSAKDVLHYCSKTEGILSENNHELKVEPEGAIWSEDHSNFIDTGIVNLQASITSKPSTKNDDMENRFEFPTTNRGLQLNSNNISTNKITQQNKVIPVCKEETNDPDQIMGFPDESNGFDKKLQSDKEASLLLSAFDHIASASSMSSLSDCAGQERSLTNDVNNAVHLDHDSSNFDTAVMKEGCNNQPTITGIVSLALSNKRCYTEAFDDNVTSNSNTEVQLVQMTDTSAEWIQSLPSSFKYLLCSHSCEKNGFNVTFRVNVFDIANVNKWLSQFMEKSKVTFEVAKLVQGKYSSLDHYKKFYRCHYINHTNQKRKVKNCPAKLVVTLRNRHPGKSYSMNRDPFLQDFPLIIELKQIHNHSIDNLSHLCRSDVFGTCVESQKSDSLGLSLNRSVLEMKTSCNEKGAIAKINPYQCDFCAFFSFNKNVFEKHRCLQTNKCLLKCLLCSKRFVRKQDLDVHKCDSTSPESSLLSVGKALSLPLAVEIDKQLKASGSH